eukprot:1423031-Rhodomonas_salina.1
MGDSGGGVRRVREAREGAVARLPGRGVPVDGEFGHHHARPTEAAQEAWAVGGKYTGVWGGGRRGEFGIRAREGGWYCPTLATFCSTRTPCLGTAPGHDVLD